MKNLLLAPLAAALGLVLSACTAGPRYARVVEDPRGSYWYGAPGPRAEAPRPVAVWVPGHWTGREHRRVWHPGRWRR